MAFFNPYSNFNPELPSFGSTPKKVAGAVKAFNDGVSQNRKYQNGPTPMARRAAAVGGGWNSDYDAVHKIARDAWAPYGTTFAETTEDIPRGLPMSRQNAATSSPAKYKIHGGMPPVDMSRYRPRPQPQPLFPPRPSTEAANPKVYYNDKGERFSGTISFAPGTSQSHREKAYKDWANKEGYFARESESGQVPPKPPAASPVSQTAGRAQPRIPSVGQPYPQPDSFSESSLGQIPESTALAMTYPMPQIVTQPTILGNRNPEVTLPEFQQPSFNVTRTEPSFSDNWGQPPPMPSFEGRFGSIDGSFSSQPDFSFRDAFINQLNNRLQQYQTGGMSGPPVFDIPSLMRQAQGSLEAGFSNPFSASTMQQGFNPSALAGLFGS